MTDSDYKERQFEDDIQRNMIELSGYQKGDASTFCKDSALDESCLLAYVQETQPDEWAEFVKIHGLASEKQFITRFCQVVDTEGLLHVLRNGFKDRSITFRVIAWKPAHKLNAKTLAAYEANRFHCTRQLHYSSKNNKSVDIVLFVNGIPLISMELKNQFTKQSVKNAIAQYKFDRDSKELIFRFNKRVLVHFAVDLTRVAMCTKLNGADSYFLPFNQGSNGAGNVGGAGNPSIANDYATSYLWKEVLHKDSLLEILQKYLHEEKLDKEGKAITNIGKRTLIFPRYHQLHAVRELIKNSYEHGCGHQYLIQHSAGSGKSNSIAWLAHQLAQLHGAQNKKIFSSVLILTDRRVLDRQLKETVAGFDHVQGVVMKVNKSQELLEAINARVPIIISTVQKFPVIYSEVQSGHNNFALIIDEAHSSTTGKAASKTKVALADKEASLKELATYRQKDEEEQEDYVNRVYKELAAHGHHHNLSFFAFTATPKAKTLELFGNKQEDGSYLPFHCYSMRQAIEEGFILDVLSHYMTYKMYFEIRSMLEEEYLVDQQAGNRALNEFITLNPTNISEKSAIILNQIENNTRYKIGGKAKAMLVCRSRKQAVTYALEISKQISQRNLKFHALVAFTGDVEIDGRRYTEGALNAFEQGKHIYGDDIPIAFERKMFRLLIVADKFQTGFDQPLLHTMFVDKQLNGVKTVQTLSRLNRTMKGKNDTFILDFENAVDDIQKDFSLYYERTHLEHGVDPNTLNDRKSELNKFCVYNDREVEDFAKLYFSKRRLTENDMGHLTHLLDPAIKRFEELEDEQKADFRSKLNAFIRTYDFVTQAMRMFDEGMHYFYAFAQFLLRLLPKDGIERVNLDGKVMLKRYELEEDFEGSIGLQANEDGVRPYGSVGTARTKKLSPLEELIQCFNERFGTKFSADDVVYLERLQKPLLDKEDLKQFARENEESMFLAYQKDCFKQVLLEALESSFEFNTILERNQEACDFLCEKIGKNLYQHFNSTTVD